MSVYGPGLWEANRFLKIRVMPCHAYGLTDDTCPTLVFGSVTCSADINAPAAPCTMMLSVDTAWHKTTSVSTLAGSFWMAPSVYVDNDVITMIYPVVRGVTGAWGKPEAFQNLALTPIGTSTDNYRLTMQYKVCVGITLIEYVEVLVWVRSASRRHQTTTNSLKKKKQKRGWNPAPN